MLTIVDHGVGNLRNVYMAFRRLGVEARLTSDVHEVRRATALVLPGVGAFGDAMGNVRSLGLEDDLVAAIRDGLPFLGICVGLQVLFEVSEEMGEHQGLGVLGGRVRRFPAHLTVPHMGWNQIDRARECVLWREVADHSYAYFVHSYFVEPTDASVVAATTEYGSPYTCAVARDNLYAIQFHPEKSQDVGAKILRNFCRAAGLLEDGG